MKKLFWFFCLLVGLFCCAHNSFADGNLPTINLSLNGTTLETFSTGDKSTKYPGNILAITTNDSFDEYSDVEIKGRGNTTWEQPKKPFQIKFQHKTNLLGLGASKKWILLANYFDDSHLRNHLALSMANLLEMPYGNRGSYVDLYVDGQYVGLYFLCHKTEISRASTNLQHEAGILVEMDNIHYSDDPSFTSPIGGHHLYLKDTVSDSEEVQQAAFKDFRLAYNRFEQALYSNDYQKIRSEIDIESFAKYFLLYEYSIDPDGLATSFYLYKDGPNDRIHAGPAWDFDFAFANFRWADNSLLNSPNRSWAQTVVRHRPDPSAPDSEIFSRLMDHPQFRQLVKKLFRVKLQPYINDVDSFLQETSEYISESAMRDNQIWLREDFSASVDSLRNWSSRRLNYLNLLYGTTDSLENGSYQLTTQVPNTAIFTSKYLLHRQNDDSLKIIDAATGRALTVEANDNGAVVTFRRSQNLDTQHWYISQASPSRSYFIAKTSGLILTATNDRLTIQDYRDDMNQSFNIQSLSKSGVPLKMPTRRQ